MKPENPSYISYILRSSIPVTGSLTIWNRYCFHRLTKTKVARSQLNILGNLVSISLTKLYMLVYAKTESKSVKIYLSNSLSAWRLFFIVACTRLCESNSWKMELVIGLPFYVNFPIGFFSLIVRGSSSCTKYLLIRITTSSLFPPDFFMGTTIAFWTLVIPS